MESTIIDGGGDMLYIKEIISYKCMESCMCCLICYYLISNYKLPFYHTRCVNQ
jgi:hypothetical protein